MNVHLWSRTTRGSIDDISVCGIIKQIRSYVTPVCSFLAVLILGVGILIGVSMQLKLEKAPTVPPEPDGSDVSVDIENRLLTGENAREIEERIWCLNHPERDVEPDTEQYVSAAVDFCKDISRTFPLDLEDGRTVAQVILEGMEEESGWRYDLWEDYR